MCEATTLKFIHIHHPYYVICCVRSITIKLVRFISMYQQKNYKSNTWSLDDIHLYKVKNPLLNHYH